MGKKNKKTNKVFVDSATAGRKRSRKSLVPIMKDEWSLNTDGMNILDSERILLVAGRCHSYTVTMDD